MNIEYTIQDGCLCVEIIDGDLNVTGAVDIKILQACLDNPNQANLDALSDSTSGSHKNECKSKSFTAWHKR